MSQPLPSSQSELERYAQLLEQAARHGDAVHLVQGDRRITFSELGPAVRLLGDRLLLGATGRYATWRCDYVPPL